MSGTKSDFIDDVDADESYDDRPDEATVRATVENLEERGFEAVVLDSGSEALDEIRSRIPAGASVMNGHSTTLEEIGYIDHLASGDHGWEDLAAEIRGTDDEAERDRHRREAQAADYFLGSVNAVAETGELVAADASGSRVGAYPFAAGNLLLVSGVNKIVPSLDAALQRLEEFAYPLEDARAREAYGQGSVVGTQLVYRHEITEGRTTVLLVDDDLGF